MKLVRTPVPGVNETVGSVTFVDGVAKVDEDAIELCHFRTAGYQIDDYDEALDAAKANEDDPAGVEVLKDLSAQQGNQEDDPQVIRDVDGDGVETVLPRRSASTEVWRQFAVEHGMHDDEAKAMTRDELVAYFNRDDREAVDDQEGSL